MKIGCASQMFSKEGTLEQVIDKISQLGFEGIELEFGTNRLHVWDIERAKKLKELCDSKDLTITNFQPHTFFIAPIAGSWQIPMQEQKELLNVKACCEMADAISVPYVRVQIISYTYGQLPPIATSAAPGSSGGQVSSRSLEDQFKQGMNTLAKAVDMAEDMGVILGLDNHYFLTVLDHLKIVKMINSPNLKLFMDVSNATLNGEDIVVNAKACGKLLVHSHVKDRTIFGSKVSGAEFTGESLVPIGMGDVDWQGYLTALKEIGYEGYLSIEGNAVGFSTEETAKIGLGYLTELRKRIGMK